MSCSNKASTSFESLKLSSFEIWSYKSAICLTKSCWAAGGLLGSCPPLPRCFFSSFFASPFPPSPFFPSRSSRGLCHHGTRSGVVSLGTPEKRGGGENGFQELISVRNREGPLRVLRAVRVRDESHRPCQPRLLSSVAARSEPAPFRGKVLPVRGGYGLGGPVLDNPDH
ncbi:hypothetical protein DY000_02041916 [Brassica cretica]|uniref:Uncharacterized protein n=1 Tax=Brassica cretica TaxID=69181 RepID=A0ABQ7B6N9_BRACR|nr:hypothetical protein DY000_02041916 [Brassica cretica]